MPYRYAIRHTTRPADELRVMERYMPSNYHVAAVMTPEGRAILISGVDSAGWSLDGYVLPRLASGMYYAREIPGTDINGFRALTDDEMTQEVTL
jgi:hypothetical protein